MTTPTPTVDHKKLVKTILESMEKANGGDPAAIADLRGHSEGSVAAAPAAPPAPPVAGMVFGKPTVTRPNGHEYHIRKLEDHDDIMVLRASAEHGIFPLLTGEPGTGKTAVLEAAFASEPGQKLYTVQGTGDTTTDDFVGSWVQLPGGGYEWVDGPLVRAMDEGAVLYIDEIALIDPKVLALVYGVMDGRDELRITQNPDRGVVKVKKGFHVVAACNPNAPGARMSEALMSRFTLQFVVTTDYGLAKKLGVPDDVVRVARNLSKKLETGGIGWAPQLRELLAYRDNEKVFGRKMALRNLVSVAPEIDRAQVADLLSRELADKVTELKVR